MLKHLLKEMESEAAVSAAHKRLLMKTLQSKKSTGLSKWFSLTLLVPAALCLVVVFITRENAVTTPTVSAAELLSHAATVALTPSSGQILSITRTLSTWNPERGSLEAADVVQVVTDGRSSLLIGGEDPKESFGSLFLEDVGSIVGTQYEFDPIARTLYAYPTADAVREMAYRQDLVQSGSDPQTIGQELSCGLEKEILVHHENPLVEAIYAPSMLKAIFDRVDQGEWCTQVNNCPTITDPRSGDVLPLFGEATVTRLTDGYRVSVAYRPEAVSLALELNAGAAPSPLPEYVWQMTLNEDGLPMREVILKDGVRKKSSR